MEWHLWQNLPLSQRERLPTQSGIYVIVDAEGQVWYVGQSTNLHARWKGRGHHRYKQFSRTNNRRMYQIYWELVPPEQLNEKEQFYIDCFKPYLNYSRVRTYLRRCRQPDEEISRLLRVINKNTLLFPDTRSVVLGYYNEVDEDADGDLMEYTCIIVLVNTNDYDKVILKSYNRSFTKKGTVLKGVWYTYESECGCSTSDPALIPVFVLDDLVYEFVCASALIEQLGQHKPELCEIELANQRVVALSNPTILSALFVADRYTSPRHINYLYYRIPILQPILSILPESST